MSRVELSIASGMFIFILLLVVMAMLYALFSPYAGMLFETCHELAAGNAEATTRCSDTESGWTILPLVVLVSGSLWLFNRANQESGL